MRIIGPREYLRLCSVSVQQAESTSLDVELWLIQPCRRVGRESVNFVLSCRNSQGLFFLGGLNRIKRDLLIYMIRILAPEIPLYWLSFLSPFTGI